MSAALIAAALSARADLAALRVVHQNAIARLARLADAIDDGDDGPASTLASNLETDLRRAAATDARLDDPKGGDAA